jgi:hypothetical protein
MNSKYSREEAEAVLCMTALVRELNAEIREGNELVEERLKLLKLCAETMREMQEEAAWGQ